MSVNSTEKAKAHAPPPAVVREVSVGRDRSIVIVTLTNLSDAEQQRASDLVRDCIAAKKAPFAVIMDLRLLSDYPATQRDMYARGRESVRGVYQTFHRITVYVVDDERQRGFLTAIGWKVPSTPNARPRVFSSDLADAQRQAVAALTDR
jgi:hypothetical protein